MTEEEKGFTVKDRRAFSEDSEADKSETPAEGAPAGEPTPETEAAAPSDTADDDFSNLPEINFATFIFSLNSSALVHLGVIEDPATSKKSKILPLAKQTIDILGMLEEKTRGNLSGDEEQLLKNILHDLRLMYVKARS